LSVRRPLDTGVERLKGIIGDMAAAAVEAFRRAMESVFTGKVALEDVRMLSEQLRFMREESGQLAIELIARFQPVATDLRRIRSCLQVSYDLSRIGRYSLDICETSILVPVMGCDFSKLRQLYIIVLYMVREVGRAFIFEDLDLAKKVRELDDDVDALYDDYLKGLLERGQKDNPPCLIAGTLVLRYLERIADHACYIADAVSYIRTGSLEIEKE